MFLSLIIFRALQLLSSGLNLAMKQISDGNLKPSDNVKNGMFQNSDVVFLIVFESI